MHAALACCLAVDFAVVEEKYVVRVGCAEAFCHLVEDFGCGLLDAHLAGEEYVVEEVADFESFVAEELVLSHAPMDGVGVAQEVDGVVLLDAKEHFETFGGNAFVEKALPCLYNGFVGHGVGLAEFS